MCNELQVGLLNEAKLNGTHVLEVICKTVKLPTPRPLGTSAGGSPETAMLIAEYASYLLAWELLGLSNDTSVLQHLCADFAQLAPNFENLGLIVSEMNATFCDNDPQQLSPKEVDTQTQKYSTNLFIQQLIHASSSAGYVSLLCSHVSVAAVDALALNGTQAMDVVCSVGMAAMKLT
jgi:hypothetical protein